ncbi:MAG: DUF2157 domain-containing protein [Saprospiraceae bacterium]
MKLSNTDIHIIKRHSNWSKSEVEKQLKEEVYQNKQDWQKFLLVFFMVVGLSFSLAGIIFFFAYNWADLNKFIKLGIVEGLVVIAMGLVLFSKQTSLVKNIILTGASVLVGVIFAVFGQIYQTGANAYDFFLAWTILITLWVVVSNFAPLWLVYLILVNTCFYLYSQQVSNDWSAVDLCTLLLLLNSFFIVLPALYSRFIVEIKVQRWFTNTVALIAVTYSTVGISIGIFDTDQSSLMILLPLAGILYTLGILLAFKEKRLFYLSIISFSLIFIISCLFMKISKDEWIFLFTSFFIILSITMVIKYLVQLQKKWSNE